MMRIALLVGCLERGKDGVGDYARDLAAACMRAGHAAFLVALNDGHVACDPVEERQISRDIEVETLRLSASSSWTARIAAARAWLAARQIGWISLQFVPYAFHRKGIVAGLGRYLEPLIGGKRVHVMFHETWIGAERGASLRHRMVGTLQRAAVLRMVRSLAPVVSHTSNPAYRTLLAAAAVPAGLLPLCGSVPISARNPGWLPRELLRLGAPHACVEPRTGCWWFGLFGSVHPTWNAEPLLAQITAAAAQNQRRVLIVSIGRLGPGAQLWSALARRYAPNLVLCTLGERNAAELSWFLQELDFGVATTPWQLIGKSATTAAMVDHGLPVIVSRDDIVFDAPAVAAEEPLLHRMDGHLARWLIEAPPRAAPRDRLPDLAARFLEDLSAGHALVVPERDTAPFPAGASFRHER